MTFVVELFANDGTAPFCEPMTPGAAGTESGNSYNFTATVPGFRSDSEYTVRVMPSHSDVVVPLEINRIVWEK